MGTVPSAFDLAFGGPQFKTGAIMPTAATVAYPTGPTVASVPAPQVGMPTMDYGGVASAAQGGGLGTMGAINAGLSGLQTIGQLWGAWQQMKLAKKQFNQTKKITDTNMANGIQSYNTAIEDRGRSRAFTEGQSEAQARAYVDKNSLPEYKRG